MVPLGRVDRGIQTQYAEVWAAQQQHQQQMVVVRQQLGCSIEGAAAVAGLSRPLSSSSSRRNLLEPLPLNDPGAGMSASTGGAAVLLGSPKAAAAAAAAAVERKQPAFTQHGTADVHQAASSSSSNSQKPQSAGSSAAAGLGAANAAALLSASLQAAAEQLLAAGAVPLLSAPALLQLVASLYSAKAAADATALRSHKPALGLWEFVLKHLQKNEQGGSKAVQGTGKAAGKHTKHGAAAGADGMSEGAAAALAQLLGSMQQHASSSKEVAQFSAALLASRAEYHRMLAAQQQKAATAAVTARLNKQHSERDSSSTSSTTSGVIKGSWGEVKLDSGKLMPVLPPNNAQQVLLPAGALLLLRRMLGWPGMLPLLRWVAGGHFLVGLRDGSLGSLLADVQVRIWV